MKTYENHFDMFKDMLTDHQSFTFSRFSDGELFIMQNQELIIDQGYVKIGNKEEGGGHPPSDFKNFNPTKDTHLREALLDAFRYKAHGYYKGIACRCCVGEDAFKWQLDLHGGDDDSLTWSNLFLNGNYSRFVDEVIPLFSDYQIVIICNKEAGLAGLPFHDKVVKDFRVGPNAMIDNYSLIEEVVDYVDNTDADLLILSAASSLSNQIAHQVHEVCGNLDTFIDIGSTLNFYMGMPINRSYLEGHWYNQQGKDNIKTCVW